MRPRRLATSLKMPIEVTPLVFDLLATMLARKYLLILTVVRFKMIFNTPVICRLVVTHGAFRRFIVCSHMRPEVLSMCRDCASRG